jgi:hypothetical protein
VYGFVGTVLSMFVDKAYSRYFIKTSEEIPLCVCVCVCVCRNSKKSFQSCIKRERGLSFIVNFIRSVSGQSEERQTL